MRRVLRIESCLYIGIKNLYVIIGTFVVDKQKKNKSSDEIVISGLPLWVSRVPKVCMVCRVSRVSRVSRVRVSRVFRVSKVSRVYRVCAFTCTNR